MRDWGGPGLELHLVSCDVTLAEGSVGREGVTAWASKLTFCM